MKACAALFRRVLSLFALAFVGFVNTMCAFLFVTLNWSIFSIGYMAHSMQLHRLFVPWKAPLFPKYAGRMPLPEHDVHIVLFFIIFQVLHEF